jgi:hypothetical protein
MSTLISQPAPLTHLANDPAFLDIWNQIPANFRLDLPPDTLMNPRLLVIRLDDAGLEIAVGTLERLRSAGGGPIYRKFGRAVAYPWGTALVWALDKMGRWRANASGAYGEIADNKLSAQSAWSMPAKRPATAPDSKDARPPAA